MNTNSVTQEELKCRICENVHNNKGYVIKEMMYGLREEFNYFQCDTCKCLQIQDFPADMSKYYPQDYYSFKLREENEFKGIAGSFRKFQYSQSLFGNVAYQATLGRIIDKTFFHLFKRLNLNTSARILDVGCGDGRNFLYPLAEMGFNNLLGCDPFLTSNIEYKNQVKINKGNVQDMQGKWDLITYHHSFEHVPNPFEHMSTIESLLDDNGTCMIRIPICSSYAWEHYGVHWAQLDAPRHFFLHSTESIRILAEKANLELFDVVYDSGHFQFSASELYEKNISLNEKKDRSIIDIIQRKTKKRRFKKMAKKLNQENRGDQAAFYLRKIR